MTLKLANAFSLNMLTLKDPCSLRVTPITLQAAREACDQGIESYVGHEDTAALLSSVLGIHVAFHRGSLKLMSSDTLLVAQLIGPRLPEGTRVLPEGASFTFLAVTIN